MKISLVLMGKTGEIPLVSAAVTLDRDAPGSAIFQVRSNSELTGNLRLFTGLNSDKPEPYFTGFIEKSIQLDNKQQRLFVRELPAKLELPCLLALRRVSVDTAATAIGDKCGSPVVAKSKQNGRVLSHFATQGSGMFALAKLSQLAGEDCRTYFMPTGETLLTEAANTKYAAARIAIPAKNFTNITTTGADLPFMPCLRPNLRLHVGNGDERIVRQVQFSGEMMRIIFDA